MIKKVYEYIDAEKLVLVEMINTNKEEVVAELGNVDKRFQKVVEDIKANKFVIEQHT